MNPASPPASTDADTAAIHFDGLTLRAGGRTLLSNVDAMFPSGRITLIVGPSGVGKSLLLRILAGEIRHRDGQIQVDGSARVGKHDVLTSNKPPSTGIVYQNFALFDELSPLDNARLAAAHRSPGSSNRKPTATELLQRLGVPEQTPTQLLSGGQQQRLAIARTLAADPQVLLYDEPTSGLDPVTAAQVAELIRRTHLDSGKTSVIVTHDYAALTAIADRVFVVDPRSATLREVTPDTLQQQAQQLLHPPEPAPLQQPPTVVARAWGRLTNGLAATGFAIEQTARLPLTLLPVWKSPRWGLHFLGHYLGLVAGRSAMAYLAVAGLIAGFVATYFTFRFLPFAEYTEPLLIENLLSAIGFAQYRILVPVLATILLAARSGAAVASDIGGKRLGRQTDALRSLGASPDRYLLTNVVYAFLLGTPVLVALSYAVSHATSLVVFTATHPDRGPEFWSLHYHRELLTDSTIPYAYQGWAWLLAKLATCAVGTALIAYHSGASPKQSTGDVSRGITRAILWSTLFVLVVHFLFTFFEFEGR